jgi:hypothetical protein
VSDLGIVRPMPIVDVELVCESEVDFGTVSPRATADAVGNAFGSPPGQKCRRGNNEHLRDGWKIR